MNILTKKYQINIVIAIWTIAMFILILWLSLVPVANNSSFFTKIWQEEGIYEQFGYFEEGTKDDYNTIINGTYYKYHEVGISEEEMVKVIDHTMDYLWGKEDELQIQVTYNDGHVGNFYQVYPVYQYHGKNIDEIAHMQDCKPLFIGGKYLALSSLFIFIVCSVLLGLSYKNIKKENFNTVYITLGAIVSVIIIFAILVVINFDKAFDTFHEIFFSNSNTSWSYPLYSNMIIMLPEDALFAKIVYISLIHFFSYMALIIGSLLFTQFKCFKKNKVYQQLQN